MLRVSQLLRVSQRLRVSRPLIGIAALVSVAGAASSALADVRAGVDAWSRGDYTAAVAEWEGPAATGDADAMFNLGQAYRLGRGVVQDAVRAEELYKSAAERGHVQAADTYGLMLFQSGRREQALPYVQDAASRGDPRSQYLLGIAHFNGDLMNGSMAATGWAWVYYVSFVVLAVFVVINLFIAIVINSLEAAHLECTVAWHLLARQRVL